MDKRVNAWLPRGFVEEACEDDITTVVEEADVGKYAKRMIQGAATYGTLGAVIGGNVAGKKRAGKGVKIGAIAGAITGAKMGFDHQRSNEKVIKIWEGKVNQQEKYIEDEKKQLKENRASHAKAKEEKNIKDINKYRDKVEYSREHIEQLEKELERIKTQLSAMKKG